MGDLCCTLDRAIAVGCPRWRLGEPREKGGGSVTEMALTGQLNRISSVPPLNSCIDRLFGVRDNMCVSGGVRDCFYVHTVVKREIALIPSSSRIGPTQSAKEGVAWREGVAQERR